MTRPPRSALVLRQTHIRLLHPHIVASPRLSSPRHPRSASPFWHSPQSRLPMSQLARHPHLLSVHIDERLPRLRPRHFSVVAVAPPPGQPWRDSRQCTLLRRGTG